MHRSYPSIQLRGVLIATGASTARRGCLEISEGRIRSTAWSDAEAHPAPGCIQIDLDGYLILPGLINSHDHLELNLFPRLGRGPYRNATEWAQDVYQPDRSPVRDHLAVPKEVRLWWGGLKNLLSGVTTVCHHNPYSPTFNTGFPVRVVRNYGWAHSLKFCADLATAHRATGACSPFVVHLAEGTDDESSNELFVLDRLGCLDHRTVLVHGVALTAEGHALLRRRGAALVWCPTSNQFILGKTLDPRSLDQPARIALGTDSALTAKGNLLDEIRFARDTELPAAFVYSIVTRSAADVLRLRNGEGAIAVGGTADLIAIPWRGQTPADALVQTDTTMIEMVMVSGRLQLVSAELADRCPDGLLEGLEWISIGATRRRVRAPVQRLLDEARKHLHDEIRLAGHRVSA